jgi:ankyrin repeat protein
MGKLRSLKITVKDIFEKQLFSDQPYLFGKQIFEAVKLGEDAKVWRYYIENKFVVYSIDSSGKSPLTWACIRGYSAIADMLIGMGALTNKKDVLGHSAFFYAIKYKQIDCIKVLALNEALISQ